MDVTLSHTVLQVLDPTGCRGLRPGGIGLCLTHVSIVLVLLLLRGDYGLLSPVSTAAQLSGLHVCSLTGAWQGKGKERKSIYIAPFCTQA